MRIGTSEKLITPEVGIELCGYVARIQPSVGCHDDLHARVLYAESGMEKIVWIHCDLIGFSNTVANSIRKSVAEALVLKAGNVFLSATHTHAGPATVYLRNCGEIDPGYMGFLEKAIVDAALEAVQKLEKTTLCFSESKVEGAAIDRRQTSPNSNVDHRLPVLGFRRDDGSFKAIIANYAMHNVGYTHENRLISADIAGFAAKMASSGIPGNPTVLLTNGGCGNINPSIQTNDCCAVEKIGGILGKEIVNETPNLKPCGSCDILSSFNELELPLEKMSLAKLEKAMAVHRKEEDGYLNNRMHSALQSWYDETKGLIEKNIPPDPAIAYIHMLKLGPVIFVGLNSEVFSKMAEDLREAAGLRQLYVVGYADGCIGYVAPHKIYDEGGYEVDDAYKFYGCFRLKACGFEMLKKKIMLDLSELIEVISKLRK